MVEIQLNNLVKSFGTGSDAVIAVNDISIPVEEGDILALLGPSGCGKSTTLRMIAGLTLPDSGQILFGDTDVTYTPPQERNTAMVFQNYALWPHMSVRDNVAYGLTLRGLDKSAIDQRVEEALGLVRMAEYIDRMPNKLSGGQQQRVAVARALVVNPDVLLLDEPLSNLDAKLRMETRGEIRDLVKNLNLTAVFVTHDQSEALSISDMIAVMDMGVVRQVGTPRNIWENPDNAFVGTFIGEANLLMMQAINTSNGEAELTLRGLEKPLKSTYVKEVEAGKEVKVVIRPSRVIVHQEEETQGNGIPAVIRSHLYLGTHERLVARLPNKSELIVHRSNMDFEIKKKHKVFLELDPYEVMAFGEKAY